MEQGGYAVRERARGTTGAWLVLVLTMVALLLAGCASTARSAYMQGEAAAERQLWDQAVLAYAKAVSIEPSNSRYKVALARAKLRAASAHFDRGKKYLANDQLELAIKELQETVILDPSNQYAQVELKKAMEELDRRRNGPSEFDRAQEEARRRAEELGPPKLDPASNVPLVLNFPDSTVQEVYEALSKASGINFLYDEKVDLKKKISVELSNVTFEKAMDILMLMNKHFYKVIDAHTILIADDNRQKRSEYADNVIRTFYLSNAETKQVQTLLRSLLETRKVANNDDLNAITIKDTPEKIKVAERIIKANDKAKGEVIVDIELLEINRSKLTRLGIDLSSKSLSLVFGDGQEMVPLNNLSRLKAQASWTLGPVPSVLLSFLKTDSDTKTIARPQLRILEGEEGKITIGDRVPIPATTFNTSNTIGGNIVPITSFTYQNVGIIVSVKPRVHHNKEITLELKLEVSSLAGSVEGTGGVKQPIIGTRTVETTIRLKDGETNLLAGLIKSDERTSLSGVPGLSDVPLLRRLFGVNETSVSDTDIVLSITPHIIRVPNIEPIDLVPLWVGTEDKIELRGVARNALGESPFAGESPWEKINEELGLEKEKAAAEKGAGEEGPGAKDRREGSSRGSGTKARPKKGKRRRSAAAPVPGRREPIENVKVRTEGGGTTAPAAGDERPPAEAEAEPARREKGERGGEELPPAGAFDSDEPVAIPAGGDEEAGSEGAEGAPSAEPRENGEDEAPPRKPVGLARIRLVPRSGRVSAGDQVVVDVVAEGASDVATVNFQLRYNPKVLRFMPPAQAGEFLAQGGAPADVQAVESAEGGLVIVSATRAGATGASGSGTIVTLRFVAVAPGTASFGFAAAQVRNPDMEAIPASFRVANVEVSGE